MGFPLRMLWGADLPQTPWYIPYGQGFFPRHPTVPRGVTRMTEEKATREPGLTRRTGT